MAEEKHDGIVRSHGMVWAYLSVHWVALAQLAGYGHVAESAGIYGYTYSNGDPRLSWAHGRFHSIMSLAKDRHGRSVYIGS